MTSSERGPEERGETERLVERAHATRLSVDAAARHLWTIHCEARRLTRRRRRQRLASVTASVMLLVMGVGAVAGSATALPGDPLYSVKEGLERTELAVAMTDAANARTHLRHARQRLEELERAAEDDPARVPELADRFFETLERAEQAGGGSVVAEVAGLHSQGALLIDRLGEDLERSVADSLTGEQHGSSRGDGGTQEQVSSRGGDGGGDDGPDEPGSGEAMPALPPETAVAGTGTDESDEPDDADASPAPAESREETGTAEVPEETGTAETPAETPPESSSATTEPEPSSERDEDPGDDGESDKRPERDELDEMVRDHHEDD